MIAEPYSIPSHPRWFSDEEGLVAIYWCGINGDPSCTLIKRGRGFVAVKWGKLIVIGCYISPNCSLSAFETYLHNLMNCVRACHPHPILVLGDFNAHSRAWGTIRDNMRGKVLLEWAASADLRLLNHGSVSTCVRWQGESIVDLSWATTAATQLVCGWRVAEEVVTLSDHRHIIIDIGKPTPDHRQCIQPTRWSLKRLDRDMLIAAANVAEWPQVPSEASLDVSNEASRFQAVMVGICDVAMPRVKPAHRTSAYWWTEDIARLRGVCLQTRRRYTRTRRRRQATAEETESAYVTYRHATRTLQTAIAKAKAQSWSALVDQLGRDPWGRPYKMVFGKLRPWVPPLTETLDPDFLGTVVQQLFPRVEDDEYLVQNVAERLEWSDEWAVSEAEFDRAVNRLNSKKTAPGPDGVPGRVLALALSVLGNRLRRLFTDCLRQGQFPSPWKIAKMVLLKKDGRDANNPSAYRPICLLDEAGKLLERVIAYRINAHLSITGPDLVDTQYGFRKGCSTVDTILRVRSILDEALRLGKIALAISLDIVNAFNSLPFQAIRQALVEHQIPTYLRKVVEDYLHNRTIQFPGRDSVTREWKVSCGVPQGSVLGPLLWILAYDKVLRAKLPVGVHVVCYADDTFIIATGNNFGETIRLAELGAAYLIRKINGLGLKIAPQKTEAIWFHNLSRGQEPPSSVVSVGNVQVQVGRYMKYLGLILDSKWDFREHFRRLIPRLERVLGALHRLLPNLGGPDEGVRRLYAGVVQSMALYGSPVWSSSLCRGRKNRALLNGLQRRVAIRIARGYRTISYEAAMLLARCPPLDILASTSAAIYHRLRNARPSDEMSSMQRLRKIMQHQAWTSWRVRLEDTNAARQRAPGAILPNFWPWMKRRWAVTYRLTQVLTGHGCFGTYLNRIGRETTPQCHHCNNDRDDAQHTLEECAAWTNERAALVSKIGRDLSPANVVRAMLHNAGAWKAMVTFCETVMVQKEKKERERERINPTRRRRRGPDP